MAKPRYNEWLKSEKLLLIRGWKRNGLTDDQIAHNMGIAPRTLAYWKKNHVQILQALKMGKEQANFIVENKLFLEASEGNVTAMIFWLKNNWRYKYNDSQLSKEERHLISLRSEKIEAETNRLKLENDRLAGVSKDKDSTTIIDDIRGVSDDDDKD